MQLFQRVYHCGHSNSIDCLAEINGHALRDVSASKEYGRSARSVDSTPNPIKGGAPWSNSNPGLHFAGLVVDGFLTDLSTIVTCSVPA
mmetsp:Transcript_101967/g.195728  ORF Transcript_101967/g.195728 Transcript_101967/m.195728 type:complete len:88 (+) Transcript_101967:1948-2211(+)